MKPVRPFPLLGAAALTAAVGLAGAQSGSAIGSMPVMQGKAAAAFSQLPSRMPERSPPPLRTDLPDHYPLVTPSGTIPVAALALHGRLRGTRDMVWDRPDAVALRADYGDELEEDEIDRLAYDRPNVRAIRRDRSVRVHTPGAIRVETVEIEDRPGWPVMPN